MFAVGRLGSYISRGVSTVSRPLQPFGGAVDIIVVEQPDGTFKSCPWYVRFGKSQAGLQPEEKVIRVSVNNVEADFLMYLDNNGDAYLLKEIDVEADSFASLDENGLSPRIRRMQKSKSYDYDANRTDFISELEAANGTTLTRENSRRGGIFGLSFGRRPNQEGEDAFGATNSLERAEMAADLLEVRWTTNLGTGDKWKPNPPQVPKPKLPAAGDAGKVEDAPNTENSLMNGHLDDKACSEVKGTCAPDSEDSEHPSSKKETDAEVACSVDHGSDADVVTVEETRVVVDLKSNESEISYRVVNGTICKDRNAESDISENSLSVLTVSCSVESAASEGCICSDEEHFCSGNITGGGSLMENEGINNNVESCIPMSRDIEENMVPQLDECSGQDDGSILVAVESMKESNDQLPVAGSEQLGTVLTSDVDTMNNQNSPVVLPGQDADTHEDNVEQAACCNGDEKTLGNIAQSEKSEDEQFSFSDDDCRIDKGDQAGMPSPNDGKECLPQGSPERNEEQVTETTNAADATPLATDKLIQEDQAIISPSTEHKSKGVSSPISIPGCRNNVEDECITPMTESLPSTHQVGVPQPLGCSLGSHMESMRIVNGDAQVISQSGVHSPPKGSEISEEIKSIVSDPAVEVSLCRHLLYEGMGYEAATVAFDAAKFDKDKFIAVGPEIVKNDKLVVRIGGLYFPWDAALPIASAIGSQGKEQVLEAKGMIAVGQADRSSVGNHPPKNMNTRNGSWKLWPFSFKRTSSGRNLADETISGNSMGKDKTSVKDETTGNDGNAEKDGSTGNDGNTHKDGSTEKHGNTEKDGSTEKGGSRVTKRKIRAKTPTSEQLASLNLKEGKNIVTFTFSTQALGNQQVDARIFLWKWDTRIVISDVDGTITK